MRIFPLFGPSGIHQGLRLKEQTPGAVLLDVRTVTEYRQGHIPGSLHLPLQALDTAEEIIENKATPLFVYCQSGMRSRQAVELLKYMGYTDVTNIGGIAAYQGEVELS